MLRKHQPAKIIVAVPVLPDTLAVFEKNTDEFVFNSLKRLQRRRPFLRRLSTGRRRSNPDVENYASACINTYIIPIIQKNRNYETIRNKYPLKVCDIKRRFNNS
jgi:hypothetical protein